MSDELRALPGSPDEDAAERAVLGACIVSARAAEDAASILGPQMFRSGAHQHVFEAAVRLADAGHPVDPAAVLADLTRSGNLARVGAQGEGTGAAYLHTLMAAGCVPAAVLWHARVVAKGHQRRMLAVAAARLEGMATDPAFDPDTHLDAARKVVDDATVATTALPLKSQAELVNEVLDGIERGSDPGVPTGYEDLDSLLGGLKPGQLIVIAARTSMGKSLMAGGIAQHVGGKLRKRVLVCSLEMTAEEITLRFVSARARVPLHAMTTRQLSDDDWLRIRNAHEDLSASAVLIDDTPRMSLGHVRARLRGLERAKDPAKLAVIDYLGLLAEPKGAENRQNAVAHLTGDAKAIAREFGIPVVLVAQVNRGPEARSDKQPLLSDIKDSGAIEADADVVMLLHREDYYERESPRAGEIDVIVAKNRQGATTVVTLAFQGHYGRIADMARLSDDWSPSRHAEEAS